MGIDDCKIINFPKFLDERGDLSFAENNKQIPFTIRRTYWSSDYIRTYDEFVEFRKN